MIRRVWCARAWLGGSDFTSGVLIETDDQGFVTELTSSVEPASDATVLSGWVMPGFVNDHSHAFHRALRGRTHEGSSNFWSWRDQMYSLAGTLTPDTYRTLARAVYAEMLMAGYTQVTEFHYLHHAPGGVLYADPNAMSAALIEAATEAGIGLTLLDALYLESAPGAEPNPVQMRFSDRDVDSWISRTTALATAARGHHAAGVGVLEHGLAVHSVRAVPPHAIAQAASVAQSRSMPLHAHVSEQPEENLVCIEHYGRTPVEVFADAGALDQEFTAVHATHLTDSDIARLGGSRICMCPTTEAELADGVGPAPALRDAGAQISIGSDSQAVIDPCEELKRLEYDQRLASGRRGAFTPEELALAGTRGPIQVGGRSDFVEFDPNSARLAGSDGLAGIVFAATSADVKTVIVGGRECVRDGEHSTLDVRRELQESIALAWRSAT